MLPLPIADLPEPVQARVVCSVAASVQFRVPPNILLAVAEKEGGRPGLRMRNSNGTEDIGVMQFNTRYLSDLARYGITASDVSGSDCYPFELAAWRLRGHLENDQGDLWRRAANWHSRTPKYNAIYRVDLQRKADKWADWLSAHFPNTEVRVNGVVQMNDSRLLRQVMAVAHNFGGGMD